MCQPLHCCWARALFIKMNVERLEYAVLKGAAYTLARSHATVWLIEHGLTENFGDQLNPILKPCSSFFGSMVTPPIV